MFGKVALVMTVSAEVGARTSLYCATEPSLSDPQYSGDVTVLFWTPNEGIFTYASNRRYHDDHHHQSHMTAFSILANEVDLLIIKTCATLHIPIEGNNEKPPQLLYG